jgi:hypothetical protein
MPCSFGLAKVEVMLETMTGISDDPIGIRPSYALKASLTDEPLSANEIIPP